MENLVRTGGYALEPGHPGGTLLRRDEAAAAPDGQLERALAASPAELEEERGSAFASEVEGAGDTTAKIERAAALCKGIGEGQALDPTQLGLEVSALLDCLERLDRRKQHKESLRMARSLATLLMLLKRWASLLQTLRIALRAGRSLGDDAAVAWAEHELGTLKLAGGDVAGAERNLGRAREIRERLGDRRGLAATERNLGALCDRLQSMVRNEELVRARAPQGGRLVRRLLAVAAVFAAFGGGMAIGMAGGDDSPQGTVAETTVTDEAADGEVSTEKAPNGEVTTEEREVDEIPGPETEDTVIAPPPVEVPPGEDSTDPAERPPPVTEDNPPVEEIETPPVVK